MSNGKVKYSNYIYCSYFRVIAKDNYYMEGCSIVVKNEELAKIIWGTLRLESLF